MRSCVQCNVDCCHDCYTGKNKSLFASAAAPTQHSNGNGANSSSSRRIFQPPISNFNNPFASAANNMIQSSSHMCLIPCTIGNITVEMLVDTGAQTSVLSSPLVRQLGLSNRLDRRFQGMAAGVGRARIIGKLCNIVACIGIGLVEFPMDFICLDIQEPLVIMG